MRSDLQIGMRQGLSNIYSLFGAESETPLEKVNRLGLHVKSGSRHFQNESGPRAFTYLRVRLGEELAERFFLAKR